MTIQSLLPSGGYATDTTRTDISKCADSRASKHVAKTDYTALSRELFEKLDAARANLGGTLPRTTAIATVAVFLKEKNLTVSKAKKPSYADMSDEEFLEYLINTYTWLNVEREIQKCSAWTTTNRKKKPSRKGIVNWLNKAEGDRSFSGGSSSAPSHSPQTPIEEPEGWLECLTLNASPNSWYGEVAKDGKAWDTLTRSDQTRIAQFVRANNQAS